MSRERGSHAARDEPTSAVEPGARFPAWDVKMKCAFLVFCSSHSRWFYMALRVLYLGVTETRTASLSDVYHKCQALLNHSDIA